MVLFSLSSAVREVPKLVQHALPPVRRLWLLIGLGVVAIIPLEMYASGWWHIAAVTLIFVAISAAVGEFRRGALERLAASEARLQLQLTRMPVACMTVDRNWVMTSWNAAAERIFGWPADEILGKPASFLLPDGFTPELTRVATTVFGGDVVERHVNQNVTKDGRIITCRWANAPLIENGEVIGILGMAEDVTEEHRIEEELRETRERHRNLLDALPHYIFSVDNDDRYTALNAHSCGYFGKPEDEIIGHTAEELGIPPKAAREWHEINARTRQAGSTQKFDLVIAGPEPRYERVITQPLRDGGGQIVGVTGISIDITDAKRAEEAQRRFREQMAHFSKMESLATLAGGIAHDFNNILSGILVHATVLDRHCKEPTLQRSIGSIKQSVERGAAVSRQILTFANRAEIRSGTVDIGRLVSDLYTLVAETFPRSIRVQVARGGDMPPIAGDIGQLQQALLNLCIEARDAMPQGGVLSIESRLAGERVMIAVSDSGVGLDKEARRRIFEPFFSPRKRTEGTGIGLAMVYGIVRAHRGEIEVDSKPGAGTTFRLYFPVAASKTSAPESCAEAALVHGERLLIIDDEPEILAGLEMQLTDAGYVVEIASNGPDALERFSEVPDLVLMDLGMPRMGAGDLIDALRTAAPNVRIVAMTGYVEPEVHAAVREAGVTYVLQKPFGCADLLTAVNAALSRREA